MNKKAFVIMSFDEKYDRVYHQAIKPAIENRGYECIRSDDKVGPANLPFEIIKEIIESEIIVADISELSPNVFYELGVSHCIGNKTITITSDLKKVPFDIKVFRVISYQKDDQAHFRLLKNDIEAAIRNIEKQRKEIPNNLVQEAGREYFDLRKQIIHNLESLSNERERIKAFASFSDKNGKLQDNTDVADKIVSYFTRLLLSVTKRLVVCICGSGAIGKSIFSRLLAERINENNNGKYRADILPTDSYMLSRADRLSKNIQGFMPESHNLKKLVEDVSNLIDGKEIVVTPYNHETGKHDPEKQVLPTDIIILEGIYSFYPSIAPLSSAVRYFIYADKHKAKELKFIADLTKRGYDVQTAFAHSDKEYSAYETYILPYLKIADFVINVDEYWKYNCPLPSDRPSLSRQILRVGNI